MAARGEGLADRSRRARGAVNERHTSSYALARRKPEGSVRSAARSAHRRVAAKPLRGSCTTRSIAAPKKTASPPPPPESQSLEGRAERSCHRRLSKGTGFQGCGSLALAAETESRRRWDHGHDDRGGDAVGDVAEIALERRDDCSRERASSSASAGRSGGRAATHSRSSTGRHRRRAASASSATASDESMALVDGLITEVSTMVSGLHFRASEPAAATAGARIITPAGRDRPAPRSRGLSDRLP